MRWTIVLGICLCTVTITHAQVHRCVGAQGRTTYQQTPCADQATGSELTIMQRPSGPTGMRESERRFLDDLYEQQRARGEELMRRQQAVPSQADQGLRCNGFVVKDFRPYEKVVDSGTVTGGTVVGGHIVGNQIVGAQIVGGSTTFIKQQCAIAELTVTGVYGRLERSVKDDLRDRIGAVLINKKAVNARSVRLQGPDRYGRSEAVQADICFGSGDHAVMSLACR